MTKSEIIDKTNEFLVEEFEVDADKIVPTAILKDTLELDSLDYVDLVVIIESTFGFKVVADDFTNVNTFQDFYDLIERKVGEKEVA
ncbi:MAG: acyl carrier protein [Cytophagaceae bacterium]|nr:acyl carrier protein [Cytophagaceae bacterium]